VNNPGAPGVPFLPGIDVSHYQQAVDWTAAARSGIQFCFIKATEGVSAADSKFTLNWQRAAEAGLVRGAYHFFHPNVPVTAQASFFLRTVNQLQPGDLPPVLDLEAADEWTNIAAAERAGLAVTWLETVASSLGSTPLVYLSPSFMTEVLENAPSLAPYRVWLAEYTTAQAPSVPMPWTTWTFWQHDGEGNVPGVSGTVDLNWFNGTLDDLRLLV
jgi:lysozyme